MPKQILKIDQFHGGLNSNSDPRDIADNELSEATDVMVDEVGKIRTLGGVTAQGAGTPEDDVSAAYDNYGGGEGTMVPGYGLFHFSHDRTGAENRSAFTGTHDGGDTQSSLTDSGETWIADALIGGIVYNVTQESSGSITDNTTTNITASMSSGDWDDDDEYYIEMPKTGDDYLVVYDNNDGQLYIYSRIRDIWDDLYGGTNEGVIDIGSSNTTTAEINYFIVDGALRVCDGNFDNSNTPKWYGYVHTTHWAATSGIGSSAATLKNQYSKWIVSEAAMPAPTKGLLGTNGRAGQLISGSASGVGSVVATDLVDTGSWTHFSDAEDFADDDYLIGNVETGHFHYATINERDSADELTTTSITGNWDAGDNWIIYPPAGTGFNIKIWWTAAPDVYGDAWGDADTFEVAASFVYDGNQETELYFYNDTLYSIAGMYASVTLYSAGAFNPRYNLFRVYYRRADAGGTEDPTWLLLCEADLSLGVSLGGDTVFQGWTLLALDELDTRNAQIAIAAPPTAITYEINSGSSIRDRITSVKYKTAVVANRRTYIGNVQYTDSSLNTVIKGDSVIKSPVNQFDTFNLNGLIEASVNDGDNIVKLEEFADRLLIFKKNKLEIVNISQEIEFLEGTFLHKGVPHPAATCKTDFGIAWVNNLGCYLYDGEQITNLLEKAPRQIIKESIWETFTTNEPMIGYIPKKRQLLITDDIAKAGDGSCFLYDMVTQSWVKGATATFTDRYKTNFTTDWNGDLIYATGITGVIQKWSDASTTSAALDIQTKDIDFGSPGQDKKVYKVYVTYKSTGDSYVHVHYMVDGKPIADQKAFNWAGNYAGGKLNTTVDTTTKWFVAELTPGTSSEANNIKSIRLRFWTGGTVPTDFEINDISIVYRLKSVK